MDINSALIIVLIFLILISNRAKEKVVAAAQNDWFIVFNVDADKRVLTLWFYPIVAFRLEKDTVVPITSRPLVTEKLSKSCPAKIINNDMWGVSVSYGRWARDNALLDEEGNPESTDDASFSAILERYLLGDFQIYCASTIPLYYQNLIIDVSKRIQRDGN